MKKTILLLFFTLLCSVGWAQVNTPAEQPKAKQQASPAVRTDAAGKGLQVFPNPSSGVVHLTVSGFKGKRTELRVMNVIGNVVYREVLNDLDGNYTKSLDLSRYANGLYYVKLQSDDYSEIRKVIIN